MLSGVVVIFSYNDLYLISNKEMQGEKRENKLFIPFNDELPIKIGDIIIKKVGMNEIRFKIIDFSYKKDFFNKYKFIAEIEVENTDLEDKKSPITSMNCNNYNNINISEMNGSNIQIGNTQITNITIQELIEKIAKTSDNETKSLLIKVLENPSVAAILGSATAGLMNLLK